MTLSKFELIEAGFGVRPTGKKRVDVHTKSAAFSAGLPGGMTGKTETRSFRMANGNRRINTYQFPVPADLRFPSYEGITVLDTAYPYTRITPLKTPYFVWKKVSEKRTHESQLRIDYVHPTSQVIDGVRKSIKPIMTVSQSGVYVYKPVTDRYRTYHSYTRDAAKEEHQTFCLNWRNKQLGVESEFSLITTGYNPSKRSIENREIEKGIVIELAREIGILRANELPRNYHRSFSSKVYRAFIARNGKQEFVKRFGKELYEKLTK